MTRPKTKILVDGGDPQETRQVKELLGFVDGQTTNPSLIAKNPHIKELIASGHKLSNREEMDEYKKIVQAISPIVGDLPPDSSPGIMRLSPDLGSLTQPS